MSRSPRLHVPGGFYHVTMRGNHRQAIFFRPADRRILESIVARVVGTYEARIHAYCWMTNHIHLLIQIADAPLGRVMLRIASQYARTVQARLRTTGHLFERRYHAVLVDEDAYLLSVLKYIHHNPLRAGMVNAISDYRWSSHAVYAGRRPRSWVVTEFALQMFHTDLSAARAVYVRWMEDPVRSEDLAPHKEEPRILGRDEFVSRVLGSSWSPRSRKSLDELLLDICERFSVTVDQLRSASKNRLLARARASFSITALESRVASISEVARALHRHEASIRGLVRRHSNS